MRINLKNYMPRVATSIRRALTLLSTLALLSACGGSSKDEESDLDDASAFKPASPYSRVIAECVRPQDGENACLLSELPLLGMEYDTLTTDRIMERVVVSHAWMGERFETLLGEFPSEMLPLFKSVTAVVIDADIRPAYYTTSTGAIYLDPAFLWLSVEEKQTINTKQDYRSGFDDPLAFRQLNRYLKDGNYAYRRGSLTDNSTRELADITLLAAQLLLHELAHANDFFPADKLDTINDRQSVADATQELSEDWISSRLTRNTPLESDTMFSLADVMYRGETPSDADLEITASEVGDAFEPDGAGDDYGYTSQFEDTAMLFETAMMKYFFDTDFEIAFTSVPENASSCRSYIIGWGVRNRIGDNNVKSRAQFVSSEILPQLNLDMFYQDLEAPMDISGDWCLDPSPSSAALRFDKVTPPAGVPEEDTLRPYF